MAELRFRILGCGSSGGVPRIGGNWGDCDPTNPRNQRKRCSMLIERQDGEGITRVLIDTSPDMRQQLIDAEAGVLNAVVFTHSHADHVHGIDDLRQVVYNTRQRLPVWADGDTQNDLISRFGYAFVQPAGSSYPPILDLHAIDGDIVIDGEGGPITLTPFKAEHGRIDALGFRVADVAYLPDVSDLYTESWAHLEGLEMWILDALRRDPHPTHIHLAKSLEWIDRVQAKNAVLTNMHIDLDYDTVQQETPDHVQPAYDGLTLRYTV
ncbi:MAG: MBL fold metallo-hydrolase [Pseudoruegeria sp.]